MLRCRFPTAPCPGIMRHWRLDPHRTAGQLDLSRPLALSTRSVATTPMRSPPNCCIRSVRQRPYRNARSSRTSSATGRARCRSPITAAAAFCVTSPTPTRGSSMYSTANSRSSPRRPPNGPARHRCCTGSRAPISRDGYRRACYARPDVSGRPSLLLQPAADIWLSVNLYRMRDAGNFQPPGSRTGRIAAAVDRPRGEAPLFAAGAKPDGHSANDARAAAPAVARQSASQRTPRLLRPGLESWLDGIRQMH